MKISRHSSATRLTALLLFIVAIISVFSATVYADAASQDTIQKQNVYYGETSLYTSCHLLPHYRFLPGGHITMMTTIRSQSIMQRRQTTVQFRTNLLALTQRTVPETI